MQTRPWKVALLILAAFLGGCGGADLDRRLAYSIEATKAEIRNDLPDFQKAIFGDTLAVLESATPESLAKPRVASAVIGYLGPDTIPLELSWVGEHPGASAVRVHSRTDQVDLAFDEATIRANERIERGVVYSAQVMLAQDFVGSAEAAAGIEVELLTRGEPVSPRHKAKVFTQTGSK